MDVRLGLIDFVALLKTLDAALVSYTGVACGKFKISADNFRAVGRRSSGIEAVFAAYIHAKARTGGSRSDLEAKSGSEEQCREKEDEGEESHCVCSAAGGSEGRGRVRVREVTR